MSLRSDLVRRLDAWRHRDREDRELTEEMQFHLDMLAQRLEREGASAAEAQRRARAHFGGVGRAQDDARQARGTLLLDDLGRDIKYAVRQLATRPAFTTIVTVTLALGMGATSAILSVVDRVLIRPAPFPHPEELVMAWGTDSTSGTTREPVSWPDLVDFRSRTRALGAIAGIVASQVNLTAAGTEPTRATMVAATGNVFSTLSVRPLAGRTFTEQEDRPGGPAVAVISASLWKGRFDADPAIVGRTLRLDDVVTEIVGVLPDDADFGMDQVHARAAYHEVYESRGRVDVWVPLRATEATFPRSTHPILAIGRLAAGASVATAQRDLGAIAADLERQHRDNAARGAHVESFDEVVLGESRPMLEVLLAAVALLLLVAAVNVANLLLGRGAARVREVALRAALGASAARLTRQFLAEGVLLVALGTVVGLAVAMGALHLLRLYGPADIPRLAEVRLDGRALIATGVLGAIVGLAFGLVPVLAALRGDAMEVLKGASGTTGMSRPATRVRDALVVAQLALCVTLSISAGLVTRSLAAAMRVDPGFSASGVLKAQYQLPDARYPRDFSAFPEFPAITQFNDRLLTRVRSLPGVTAAAIAGAHPMDAGFTNSWRVVGREAEGGSWPEISVRVVSPGYLETMGLATTSGRAFGAGDGAGSPAVALLNETAARRFFRGSDPVGQRISFWGIPRLVIGVVGDERIHGLTAPAPPATYIPIGQAPLNTGVLLVRTRGEPMALASAVRGAIAATDPQLAVYGIEPFQATVVATLGRRRATAIVLGAFALVTIVLAIVGVHGVVSHAAVLRTREIGIRQALGATRGGVIGLVLRGTARQAMAGIALGLAGAVAASGLLASLLFGVSRFDPATFVIVPATVGLLASLSSYVPARRAARAGPLVAIRSS